MSCVKGQNSLLGPFHMEVQDRGQVRSTALVGYIDSVHTIYLFSLIALICKVGYPAMASYPGQPVHGNPLQLGAFSPCESLRSGVTCLTEVIKLLRHNMAANRYERGQLIRRIHLQNADETDSTGDNLSVGSDSRANQRKQFRTNVPQNKSAKRSNRKPPKVRAWTSECVDLLRLSLKYRAVAFWTSPRFPWVAREEKYSFSTGK